MHIVVNSMSPQLKTYGTSSAADQYKYVRWEDKQQCAFSTFRNACAHIGFHPAKGNRTLQLWP
jgi:hypothetical protein